MEVWIGHIFTFLCIFTIELSGPIFVYSSAGQRCFFLLVRWEDLFLHIRWVKFFNLKNFHASSWISNGAPLINRQPHFRQINLYVEFYPSFSKVPIEKQVLPTNPFIFVIV